MEALQTPLTSTSLKDMLTAKEFNNLGNSFRNSLTPDEKTTHEKVSGDDNRRDWMVRFVLDPYACKLKGTNTHSIANIKRKNDNEQWLMQSQIAGPKFLNSAELAEILCDSGELDSRPNEYKCFRDKNIPQFMFEWSKVNKVLERNDTATVQAETELTPEDFAKVRDGMEQDVFEKPPKKAKQEKKVKKEPESEEDKRRWRSVSQMRRRRVPSLI